MTVSLISDIYVLYIHTGTLTQGSMAQHNKQYASNSRAQSIAISSPMSPNSEPTSLENGAGGSGYKVLTKQHNNVLSPPSLRYSNLACVNFLLRVAAATHNVWEPCSVCGTFLSIFPRFRALVDVYILCVGCAVASRRSPWHRVRATAPIPGPVRLI